MTLRPKILQLDVMLTNFTFEQLRFDRFGNRPLLLFDQFGFWPGWKNGYFRNRLLLTRPGPNPTNIRIPKIIGFLTRNFIYDRGNITDI